MTNKLSTTLRNAAKFMDATGFDPEYSRDGCGCFIRAFNRAAFDAESFPFICKEEAIAIIESLVGANPWVDSDLRKAGWTGKEATKDAVAVLEMAADIAEARRR